MIWFTKRAACLARVVVIVSVENMLCSLKAYWIDYENIDDGKLRCFEVVFNTEKLTKQEVAESLMKYLNSRGITPCSVFHNNIAD
jgi:hypothetical protein